MMVKVRGNDLLQGEKERRTMEGRGRQQYRWGTSRRGKQDTIRTGSSPSAGEVRRAFEAVVGGVSVTEVVVLSGRLVLIKDAICPAQ
jgi:hypothetical protein